jgi:hypothetical protein
LNICSILESVTTDALLSMISGWGRHGVPNDN